MKFCKSTHTPQPLLSYPAIHIFLEITPKASSLVVGGTGGFGWFFFFFVELFSISASVLEADVREWNIIDATVFYNSTTNLLLKKSILADG